MRTKRFTDLLMLPIALGALGLMVMGLFVIQTMTLSLNGRVCNYSSTDIWLTVTESGRQEAYSLPPGDCTNVLRQDAEAIWGKDCKVDPCRYRAWKVSAGRFEVFENSESRLGPVLQIDGWGAGSRWHITDDWPKPDLSSINYMLIR